MPTNWGANLLRLSIFCSENTTASEATWQSITGQDEADNRSAVPGGKSYSGLAGGGLLTLTYAGPRVDLVLQPKPDEKINFEVPAVGLWADVHGTFNAMALALFASISAPIIRMAVGGVLLSKTDTLEQSYEQLQALLKSVKIEPKRMRDLLFRVNWPIESKVAGVKVNRLTTWAAMRYSSAMVQLTGDKMSVAEIPADALFAVRLECDHNTDGNNQKPFENNKIVPIYEELIKLLEENATKGEVLS